MAKWDYRVDLRQTFHNPELSMAEKAPRIAASMRVRLKGTRIWDDEIDGLLEELADQTAADDFDDVWDAVYDWCDTNRVWIETRPFVGVPA